MNTRAHIPRVRNYAVMHPAQVKAVERAFRITPTLQSGQRVTAEWWYRISTAAHITNPPDLLEQPFPAWLWNAAVDAANRRKARTGALITRSRRARRGR